MPAAVLFLTILAFNLIGDVLSKRFDIKETHRMSSAPRATHSASCTGPTPGRCSRSTISRPTSAPPAASSEPSTG